MIKTFQIFTLPDEDGHQALCGEGAILSGQVHMVFYSPRRHHVTLDDQEDLEAYLNAHRLWWDWEHASRADTETGFGVWAEVRDVHSQRVVSVTSSQQPGHLWLFNGGTRALLALPAVAELITGLHHGMVWEKDKIAALAIPAEEESPVEEGVLVDVE